jgi:hypothetical protein
MDDFNTISTRLECVRLAVIALGGRDATFKEVEEMATCMERFVFGAPTSKEPE